jgi:hypothetical protein
MTKFPTVLLTDKEGFVLDTLWENPQGKHSTYSLSLSLNKGAPLTDPGGEELFIATQEAVEHLYELGLLKGTRLSDAAKRIYFDDLKLNTKGEQETIRYRKGQEKLKRALPGAIEASRKVIEEMERFNAKQKK